MTGEQFKKIFELYETVFEEKFPMMHYQSASQEEMVDMMRECVAQNKNASELYPIDMDNNY